MIEYDKKICNKIYLLLKNTNTKDLYIITWMIKSKNLSFKKFLIFFFNQKFLKQINDYN